MENFVDIEDVVTHDSLIFERAYSLIHDRIPFEERSDALEFVVTLDKASRREFYPDNYHMLAAKRGSEVVGTATGYYISEINMGFINTLVVGERCTGGGIGTCLREGLIQRLEQDARDSKHKTLAGVLGEVEQSNPWLMKLISDLKVFVPDIEYIQPPLREKLSERILVLYVQARQPFKKIRRSRMVEVVRAIYRNIYDIETPESNRFFQRIVGSFVNRNYISEKKL